MNMPRITKEHAALLRRETNDYLAARGRTEAAPRPQRSAPPQADPVREEVRAAIAGERVKAALADLRADAAVSRTIREIVAEEFAAANPTPAELAKRGGLFAVRGLGVGMPSLSLDGLAREVAAAVGCTYSAAVLALTTEDAR